MQEPFDLPVNYKGQELFFPAQLQQSRYTYRFAVDVYGQEIFFERDDEGGYRALADPEQLEGAGKPAHRPRHREPALGAHPHEEI
jgi:hypothetical protein